MMGFPLMEDGWITHNMVMSGCQMKPNSDRIIQTVIGHIPIMDGRGYQLTIGVGPLSTMEDGFMITLMVGCGRLAMIGHQPGLAGEVMRSVMDGHRSGHM